jgi:hypothetical protein
MIQINVNRSSRAHDLAHATAAQNGADFILISEPNKNRARGNRSAYTNKDLTACIINASKKYNVYSFRSGSCFVGVETEQLAIYSVYISPNISQQEFDQHLMDIFDDVQKTVKKVIIAGDLNAKHVDWGGKTTDARGKALLEWAHALELILLNDGKTPTLIRSNGVSFIDLTFVSPCLVPRIQKWQVMEDETLSDHKCILTCLAERKLHSDKIWIRGNTDTVQFRKVRSGQVRSGQVRSGQVRSGQVRSGQVRSGQVRSGQVRSGQVRSGQVRSGQVRSGQVRSGQVRSGQVRSGQVRSGQVRSGQVRSGQVRSGQVRSGQVRSPSKEP